MYFWQRDNKVGECQKMYNWVDGRDCGCTFFGLLCFCRYFEGFAICNEYFFGKRKTAWSNERSRMVGVKFVVSRENFCCKMFADCDNRSAPLLYKQSYWNICVRPVGSWNLRVGLAVKYKPYLEGYAAHCGEDGKTAESHCKRLGNQRRGAKRYRERK